MELEAGVRHQMRVAELAGTMMESGSRAVKRECRSKSKLPLQLLILTSLGLLYGDILLFRVGGFAVTLVHVMLVLTTAAILGAKRRTDLRLVLVVYVMVLIQVCHALLCGFSSEIEWVKSFAQFVVYAGAFVWLAGLRADRAELLAMGPWLRKCAFFFSGLGLVQFIVTNAGFAVSLPDRLRVKAYDPFSEHRAGGFVPVNGFAVEPAYYAMGLVTLLGLLLFLETIGRSSGRRASNLAILMMLVAIGFSFSMAGILSTAVLMFVHFMSTRASSRPRYLLLVLVLVLAMAVSGVAGPIQWRLRKIARGADSSALVRVTAAMRLLFAAPASAETFFLGTGLGMEERGYATYARIYQEVSRRDRVLDEVKIHNILSAVRFLQGWIGVMLYGLLLWMAVRIPAGRWREVIVLLALLVMLHFASGLYLHPSTWATFGLLAIVGRAQLTSGRRSVDE